MSVSGAWNTTHGDPETYPHLANVIGFIAPDSQLGSGDRGDHRASAISATARCLKARAAGNIDGIDWFRTKWNGAPAFPWGRRGRFNSTTATASAGRRATTAAGT